MKKIFSTVSIIVLFTCANSFAQDKVTIEKEDIKPARDFITLSMHYDTWLNTPEEVNITGFGRGFSGHLSYDFPIKQSHFSRSEEHTSELQSRENLVCRLLLE